MLSIASYEINNTKLLIEKKPLKFKNKIILYLNVDTSVRNDKKLKEKFWLNVDLNLDGVDSEDKNRKIFCCKLKYNIELELNEMIENTDRYLKENQTKIIELLLLPIINSDLNFLFYKIKLPAPTIDKLKEHD